MMGSPRTTFPLASIMTTVRLAVMRTMPPNWAAAPMKANLLGSGNKLGFATFSLLPWESQRKLC